jgi:dUTP pyrophosphatase
MASAAERRLANKIGGRRQPMSGALASYGMASFAGDVVNDKYLFEHKIRGNRNKNGNKVVSLLLSWIEKAAEEALAISKIPVIVFKCKYSKLEFLCIEQKWVQNKDEILTERLSDKCINEKSISIEEDVLKNLLSRFNAVSFNFKKNKTKYFIFEIDEFISMYINEKHDNNTKQDDCVEDMNDVVNIMLHPDTDEKWVPSYQRKGDAGIDLRARIEKKITIGPLERTLIPVGIYISLPNDIEAQIRTRSGMAIQYGGIVANSPGTIDSGYRGEIKVILYNISEAPITINRGDRIAQMVFNKIERFRFNVVDDLDETERGNGGFGHTGLS